MKILLITDEEWNDAVYGNNVLTNWFDGFDAEFAQIYCSPGLPYNRVCHRYFRITDIEMLRSLFSSRKAGSQVIQSAGDDANDISKINVQRIGGYKWLKSVSLYAHEPMMIIRDLIWRCGRYDLLALKRFVDDFRPDVVFCPRVFTPKLMRLERLVSNMTEAPFVAFTADNEASLKCYSWSPLFWIRRFVIYRAFQRHVGLYRHYFTFSEEQANDYRVEYGLTTSCLYKCGSFLEEPVSKPVRSPIRMVFAGRLYCNRWKTLAAIGDALEKLNSNGKQMILDVYTAEALTPRQRKVLSAFRFLSIHPAITPEQLSAEYRNADIALHVESFDRHSRSATRYSFSTKIIDLMASTCSILAICWERHAGYQYLKKNDAAFCVSSYDGILPMLERICQNPDLIWTYAQKAWRCGVENHSRVRIQGQIKESFGTVINQKVKDNE